MLSNTSRWLTYLTAILYAIPGFFLTVLRVVGNSSEFIQRCFNRKHL